MNEKLLFELHPNPLVIFDRDTLRILAANEKFCDLYKYTPDEITRQKLTIEAIYVPAELPKLREHFAGNNDAALFDSTVWQHQSKDDKAFYVKALSRKIAYEDYDARLVSLVDVTDEISNGQQDLQAYSKLSYHIKNTSLALFQWDSQFRIIEWSERAAEISGYAKAEVMGETPLFFDFFNADEAEKVKESMQALISGEEQRHHQQVRLKHKTGDLLTFKIHSSALQDSEGKLESVVTLIENLTEQKYVEDELRKNEKLFKKLFVNAPQAIVMIDAKNKVQEVNNSFEYLFGYQAKELVGKDLNNVIKAAEGYEKAPKITDLNPDNTQIYRELRRYTKDGTELDVVVGSIPVHLDGELIAGFGIYIDVTNQKEIQRKLEQSLTEKQVLIEEVHHRVKNNLAVISGLLQMQVLHVEDEQLAKYIQNSQLRIQSMAIVHEMLYKSQTLSHIKMKDYLKKLTEVISDTLSPNKKTIETVTACEDIVLNVNQAIPCALIVNELITRGLCRTP
jgi:PAS domain S-box-containing protein